jgi:hypothetical protein
MEQQPNSQTVQTANQPVGARSKSKPIFLAVLVIVAIGGIYLWQHSKVSNLNKQLISANTKVTSLQKQVSDFQETAPTSGTLTANTNNKIQYISYTQGGTEEQQSIKKSLSSFYTKWNTDSKGLSSVKEYITSNVEKNSNKNEADLFTCSQMKLTMIVIENPSIIGSTATVNVLPIENSDYVRPPLTLSLVSQNSKWLIDKASCPTY